MLDPRANPVAAVQEESISLPPGDSTTQREAEAIILADLGVRLGVYLVPKRMYLADGTWVEVDGVSDEPPILCEVLAHQGAPKSAQRNKVLADALKLAFVATLRQPRPRLILALSHPAAAQPFTGRSWYAYALREMGIEVIVVDIPEELRERIRQAQTKQYR